MFGLGKKKEKVENLKNKKEAPIVNKKEPTKKKVNPTSKKKTTQKKFSLMDLYDDMIANVNSGDIIIDDAPKTLTDGELNLGWGKIISKSSIIKLFILNHNQSWISKEVKKNIKNYTTSGIYTVKFNYFIHLSPYTINWNSPKMKDKLKRWDRRIQNDTVDRDNVFQKRETAAGTRYLQDNIDSFEYYNQVDIFNHRSLSKFSLTIELIGDRNNIEDFEQAVANFKAISGMEGLEFTEVKADIYEWMRAKLPTSLRISPQIVDKTFYVPLSDDTVTSMLSVSQGKMGNKGVPLGIDVNSGLPVFHVFREDHKDAENILVSAGTGGGKSVFTKNIIVWALKEQLSVVVLDYEGDEYTNLAHYINSGNAGEAIIVNMNAGSGKYFDPLKIAELTGVDEIDRDAKQSAVDFTKAMFRILLAEEGKVSLEEDSIISEVITKVYREHAITDNPKTWSRSLDLSVYDVYNTLIRQIERRAWMEKGADATLQKVAERMRLKLKKYFVPGESEYGTFGEQLDIKTIRNSRFIVFSFGQKGADQQGANEVKIALKQLCISKITNEISNYNKYVKGLKFTLKVWEEVQRFVNIKGAEDIMQNCVTGGRKRGDISFIITNDLASLLDGKSEFMKALKTNLTGYFIGYIPDKDTRELFCELFGLNLFLPALNRIFQENSQPENKDSSGKQVENPYRKAFLVKLNATTKSPAVQAVVKAAVSPTILASNVFDGGKSEDMEDNT